MRIMIMIWHICIPTASRCIVTQIMSILTAMKNMTIITIMNMVITNIISGLPNQDACVVLCHDTKEYTVKAMEYLIPWLLDHGYSIQPLQFDSEPAHHGVQN